MSDPLASPSDGSQMLLMGHRGVGTCEEQELLQRRCAEAGMPIPERIRENTLRSMLATHAAGGHYVEFDVQLSRDLVPIIHHNFYTDDGRFVGDLTLAELQALNHGANSKYGPEEHQFATLESFFDLLPETLGFDVEIKYPRRYLNGVSLCPEFHWTADQYVSVIASAVKTFSGRQRRRPLFYSCFVSEVCVLIRELHPDCPVVYLVNHKDGPKYTEFNGISGAAGLEFAVAAGLQGVAVNSEELLQPVGSEPEGREFALACKRQGGIRCLTWGPGNNSSEYRQLQRAWGIDGIIFDNIHARDDV